MNKRAFTLMELLIVIAIIAVLCALLMPAIGKAVDNSRQTKCASNLRQLYAASSLFAQDRDGVLVYNLNDPFDGWTWVEALAPYLEKVSVSQGKTPASILACPSETRKTTAGEYSHYGKNLFINENYKDLNPWSPPKYRDIRLASFTEPSKTLLFADGANRDLSVWNTNFGFSFRHNGRANILYADGHIEPMLQKDMPGTGGDDIYKYPWSAIPTK